MKSSLNILCSCNEIIVSRGRDLLCQTLGGHEGARDPKNCEFERALECDLWHQVEIWSIPCLR